MNTRAQLLPPDDIIDVDVGSYEIPDEEKEYAKWRADFGDEESGGRIKVYLLPEGRENKKNSRNIFLFGAALDEYDYEGLCGKLVREFGTGIYRIRQVRLRSQPGPCRKCPTIHGAISTGPD